MEDGTIEREPHAGREGTVWLYMDEAGNFDVSGSGSVCLILTCVVMRRPFNHVPPLASLKYDCLEFGVSRRAPRSHHEFHATEDVNPVRDAVFSVIREHAGGCRVYAAVLDKRLLPAESRTMVDAYALLFGWLVRAIVLREDIGEESRAVIVTDAIRAKGKNEALRAALKRHLKVELSSRGATYLLYQHQSESDLNLQLADYCCWAVQRRWEQGDPSRLDSIAGMVALVGDPLGHGAKTETDPPIPKGKSTTGDLSAGRNVY